MNNNRQWVHTGAATETQAGHARAVAEGQLIFVSGTIGMDPVTGVLPTGAAAQAQKALDIIEAALVQLGSALPEVLRVRISVPDRADIPAVNAVLKARLGVAQAAHSTNCAPLAHEAARVEIEVTAARLPPVLPEGA